MKKILLFTFVFCISSVANSDISTSDLVKPYQMTVREFFRFDDPDVSIRQGEFASWTAAFGFGMGVLAGFGWHSDPKEVECMSHKNYTGYVDEIERRYKKGEIPANWTFYMAVINQIVVPCLNEQHRKELIDLMDKRSF